MRILWPGFFFLLGIIPVIAGVYIWMLRRRRRFVVRFSSLSLLREAVPHQSRLRRHLPFALFLFAVSSLVIAAARPASVARVPAGQATILLTIDVSRSMCATDIQPNRMEAAKAAALSFIEKQVAGARIGIVAFAGFAELIQAPTTEQQALHTAIESLNTARRTAIGSGILEALDAIAEVDTNIDPVTRLPFPDSIPDTSGPNPAPKTVFAPHIIVLLTDGVSNSGPEPLDAAQQAVERGIRIYTIGFGTDNEDIAIPLCDRRFQGSELFGQDLGGWRGFGGGGFRRGIDEATLKKVSAMTGGKYYAATSADELYEVFRSLPTSFVTQEKTTEISVVFAAAGALLAALAVILAMLWNPLY